MYQEAAEYLSQWGWASGRLFALSFSTRYVYMAVKTEGTERRNICVYVYIYVNINIATFLCRHRNFFFREISKNVKCWLETGTECLSGGAGSCWHGN